MAPNKETKTQRARRAELFAASAAKAMSDYEAEKLATAAKTERLRALRLAKEAEDARVKETAPDPVKRASSEVKVRRSRQGLAR